MSCFSAQLPRAAPRRRVAASPASPLVRGRLLHSNAQQFAHSRAPISFFTYTVRLKSCPFQDSPWLCGPSAAGCDRAVLMGSLSPSLPLRAYSLHHSFAMLSILPISTMTFIKYTPSLSVLFPGHSANNTAFTFTSSLWFLPSGHFLTLKITCDKLHRKCHRSGTKKKRGGRGETKLNQQLLDTGEEETAVRATCQEALSYTASPLGAYWDIRYRYPQPETLLPAGLCLTEVKGSCRSEAGSLHCCASTLEMASCSVPQRGMHRGGPRSTSFLPGLMMSRFW